MPQVFEFTEGHCSSGLHRWALYLRSSQMSIMPQVFTDGRCASGLHRGGLLVCLMDRVFKMGVMPQAFTEKG